MTFDSNLLAKDMKRIPFPLALVFVCPSVCCLVKLHLSFAKIVDTLLHLLLNPVLPILHHNRLPHTHKSFLFVIMFIYYKSFLCFVSKAIILHLLLLWVPATSPFLGTTTDVADTDQCQQQIHYHQYCFFLSEGR